VTFTNKAAKEMLTRWPAMLPINTRGMWIGTFHGLCNRLLRAHHRDAGLPQLFQILDSADQLAAVKRLLKSLNVDDEKFPPRELCHFINAQKEAGPAPARSKPGTTGRASASSSTKPTRRSASAKAWSISPNCCCAATNCWSATNRCAGTTRSASATSWSTSSRTPTSCSTAG
jgi:superfamily I DNA/RNA helicase